MVFQRLRDYDLKIKASKCEFGKLSVNFLAHTISDKGSAPMKERIDAIVALQ